MLRLLPRATRVDAVWAEQTEAHWSYMDGYADRMIARGPTLTDDGAAATGSLHIIDLPDAAGHEPSRSRSLATARACTKT